MNNIYTTLGASNHTSKERQLEDYYATPGYITKLLCKEEQFSGVIWEPACGGGHMAEALKECGYEVISSDLYDRGYGESNIDFLQQSIMRGQHIITNPPYIYAQQFVEKSLSLLPNGGKAAFFLKLTFLEGQKRREFFKKYPPKTIYVSSSRVMCVKDGDFSIKGSSAIAYAWFVWEKGFTGAPIIKWIN